jgi:hypothetical protein
MAILLAIVPVSGLLTFGNWRDAWRYSKEWARSIGIIMAAALIIFVLVWPFMPPPPQ